MFVLRPYRLFLLIERNRIPSFIAFCATAPRVRRSFFPAWVAESLSLARFRRLFTSSFDHARIRFAIDVPLAKAHIIPEPVKSGLSLAQVTAEARSAVSLYKSRAKTHTCDRARSS
jgi:hypothetical protein